MNNNMRAPIRLLFVFLANLALSCSSAEEVSNAAKPSTIEANTEPIPAIINAKPTKLVELTTSHARDGLSGTSLDRSLACGDFKPRPTYLVRSKSGRPLRHRLAASPYYGEHPFLLRLKIAGYPMCSATILDDHHLLTAAHCAALDKCLGELPELELSLDQGRQSSVQFNVTKVAIHPQFVCEEIDEEMPHDVALIRTAEKIPFQFTPDGIESTNKICMPKSKETKYRNGEYVQIVGWGLTKHLKFPMKPMYAAATLLTSSECNKILPDRSTDDDLCVYIEDGELWTCDSDLSGAAVLRNVDGSQELVGIIGHNFHTTCNDGIAAIYKASKYSDWIKSAIKSEQ